MTTLALDGLRVVDLTGWSPDGLGALCGRILADLGAEVVLVEPPGGSPTRQRAPLAPDGSSLWFAHRSVNERAVVLDLHDGAARAQLETLVAGADALVESSGPGGRPAIDEALGPRGLALAYPHLVVCSISHFGADGPRAHWAGTDLVDAAAGNMVYRFGPRHRPPVAAPGSMASDSAGLAAALAVLAGWHQRLGNGHGQWLEVSAVEAIANLADWSLPMFSALGRDQVRDGAGTLYPIYRCADGHLRMVTPLTGREWTALVEWLGHPDSVSGDEWNQPAVRMAHLAELRDLLAEFFADKPRDVTVADGIARGLAIAPILAPGEVLDHPHFTSRHTFADMELPTGTKARLVDGFASIGGARVGVRTPPPSLPGSPGLPDGAAPWPARPTPDGSFGLGPRPFTGLRVLDFGIGGVGVECSRILGLLGADVVKVESAANPDFQRVVLGGSMNGAFASSSRSKRALGVSLTDPEGVKLVHRLAAVADVVVENRGTGALDRLGIGWDALHAVNPRLVMVSSQLMGDRGVWADWKGYGPITRAVSGLAWLWNHPEDAGDPQGVTTIHPDHQAGRWMAVFAIALLLRRARTGEGGRADVAQAEVIVGQLGDLLAAESAAPGSVQPVGNHGPDAPWGVYRCADVALEDGMTPGADEDWVAISVRDDGDWARLAGCVGAPEWDDARYATREGRLADRAALDARLGRWTATQTASAVADRLQAAGVPAARAVHPRTLLGDEHERARGYLVALEQPGVGPMWFEGPPWRGPDIGEPIETPAPWPGQHTRDVCRDWLGLRDDEIAGLIGSRVLEQWAPDG